MVDDTALQTVGRDQYLSNRIRILTAPIASGQRVMAAPGAGSSCAAVARRLADAACPNRAIGPDFHWHPVSPLGLPLTYLLTNRVSHTRFLANTGGLDGRW
jgi:hypothetical protein